MIRLTRIDRYIGTHVLAAFLIVLLVVVGLMALSMLLQEMEDLNSRYRMSEALSFIVFSLPGVVYQLLPMSALVGTLAGLGVLASSSELTIMRASGLSFWGLLGAIAKPVVLIAVVALLLGEFGVPQAQQKAQNLKAIAQSNSGRIVNHGGAWFREGDAFVHITAIAPGGELIGVTEHRFAEDHRLKQTTVAERAEFSSVTQSWVLKRVQKQILDPISGRMERIKANELPWNTAMTGDMFALLLVQPMDLPISGLYIYGDYLSGQGVNATRYELAFWNKLLQPLSILALVLIGTAFIFGPLRSVTIGQRILTGVVIGLIFKFSQDLLAPASQVLGFAPILAAAIPIVISFVVAGYLMLRVR